MVNILVVPNLDQIVTSSGHEPPLLTGARVGADQAASRCSGGPANRIHPHSMSVERLVGPGIVPELKDTNVTVRGGTGKKTPAFMGSPRYHVDGSSVEREIKDLGPCGATDGGGCVLGLFPPDQDLAIV